MAFGRQSGKSWTAKYLSLDEAANKGGRVWHVFPNFPAAADHWAELLIMLDGFPVKHVDRKLMQITFLSGGTLRIRSAHTPDSLRGASLTLVILDEAAFMDEIVWFKILQPTLTATGGRAVLVSTPKGQNWFWRLWRLGQNETDGYRSWHAPSYISPYQSKADLDLIRRSVPDIVWREEYLAEFLSTSGGVFTGVDEATVVDLCEEPQPGGEYIAGIDWGVNNDYSTFTVIDVLTRRQIYGNRYLGSGFGDVLSWAATNIAHWSPKYAFLEANGIGRTYYSALLEKYQAEIVRPNIAGQEEYSYLGETRVVAVTIDNTLKRDLVERLSYDIQFGHLLLLSSENDYGAVQMSELSTYERTVLSAGAVKFAARPPEHDDTVSALIMCYRGMPPVGNFVQAPVAQKSIANRNKQQKEVNPFTHSRRVRGDARRY